MSEPRKGWIPPHTHCRTCGKAITIDKTFCSKKCGDDELKAQQKSKRVSRIYMVFLIVVMITLLLWSFTTRG